MFWQGTATSQGTAGHVAKSSKWMTRFGTPTDRSVEITDCAQGLGPQM
jgi:hypothetical protein